MPGLSTVRAIAFFVLYLVVVALPGFIFGIFVVPIGLIKVEFARELCRTLLQGLVYMNEVSYVSSDCSIITVNKGHILICKQQKTFLIRLTYNAIVLELTFGKKYLTIYKKLFVCFYVIRRK